MRRAPHVLLALLAVIGLLSVTGISAGFACPKAAASMAAMHHHHHRQQAPANADNSFCAACMAVLPSLPLIRSHMLSPVALIDGAGVVLAGIDLGLDPPPPRIG